MAPIKGDDGLSMIPIPAPGTFGALGDSNRNFGVVGISSGPAGVFGASNHLTGSGVFGRGINTGGTGVTGEGRSAGVQGTSDLAGVFGVATSNLGEGVRGASFVGGNGVVGVSNSAIGVLGSGDPGSAARGVFGNAPNGVGVEARSTNFVGLYAHGRNVAAVTHNDSGVPNGNQVELSRPDWAGVFQGPVWVWGYLRKSGGGFFIDHPDDPANKYLEHSFVESPERKNVYDGIAVLNKKGEAQVELPKWFATLNRDFRYQLTSLGQHAPVYIAQEIEGNRFRIAGGSPGLKVSWQVTGIRQDPWAKANPLAAEQDKPKAERGTYLAPALYDQPQEKSLGRAYVQEPEPVAEEVLERARERRPGAAEGQP